MGEMICVCRNRQVHGRNCRLSDQSGSNGSPSFLSWASAKGKSGIEVFRNACRKLRRKRRNDIEAVVPEADYGSASCGFEFSSALKKGAANNGKRKEAGQRLAVSEGA